MNGLVLIELSSFKRSWGKVGWGGDFVGGQEKDWK